MKRTVFISHSSQDKKIADAVCNFLEEHDVLCWIAPRDITPGKNYGAAIIDAISECEFFVLILSSLSNDSQQVVREVERAASTDSVIIPLRVEAVQPSKNLQFYVSSSHWLDAVTPPLDQHLMELLRAIEGLRKDEGQRRRRIPQPAKRAAFEPAPSVPPEAKEDENRESKKEVSPAAEPARPPLNEVLPGVWQVQIQSPFLPSVAGQLNVEMFSTGMFRGQLTGPMGWFNVEGQWHANPANNQIGLQGFQTNGFQTAPYIALVQVSSVDSRQIVGMTSAGEQVTWRRVGPPPVPPVAPG